MADSSKDNSDSRERNRNQQSGNRRDDNKGYNNGNRGSMRGQSWQRNPRKRGGFRGRTSTTMGSSSRGGGRGRGNFREIHDDRVKGHRHNAWSLEDDRDYHDSDYRYDDQRRQDVDYRSRTEKWPPSPRGRSSGKRRRSYSRHSSHSGSDSDQSLNRDKSTSPSRRSKTVSTKWASETPRDEKRQKVLSPKKGPQDFPTQQMPDVHPASTETTEEQSIRITIGNDQYQPATENNQNRKQSWERHDDHAAAKPHPRDRRDEPAASKQSDRGRRDQTLSSKMFFREQREEPPFRRQDESTVSRPSFRERHDQPMVSKPPIRERHDEPLACKPSTVRKNENPEAKVPKKSFLDMLMESGIQKFAETLTAEQKGKMSEMIVETDNQSQLYDNMTPLGDKNFPVPKTGMVPMGKQGMSLMGQQGMAPTGQQGMAPIGQQGMVPMGQQGMVPMGQQGMVQMGQQGMVPMGPRGMVPMGPRGMVPMDLRGLAPMGQNVPQHPRMPSQDPPYPVYTPQPYMHQHPVMLQSPTEGIYPTHVPPSQDGYGQPDNAAVSRYNKPQDYMDSKPNDRNVVSNQPSQNYANMAEGMRKMSDPRDNPNVDQELDSYRRLKSRDRRKESFDSSPDRYEDAPHQRGDTSYRHPEYIDDSPPVYEVDSNTRNDEFMDNSRQNRGRNVNEAQSHRGKARWTEEEREVWGRSPTSSLHSERDKQSEKLLPIGAPIPGLDELKNVDEEDAFLYGDDSNSTTDRSTRQSVEAGTPRESSAAYMNQPFHERKSEDLIGGRKESLETRLARGMNPPAPTQEVASSSTAGLSSWIKTDKQTQGRVEEPPPSAELNDTLKDILKSIGFDFEYSKRMQEKAKGKDKVEKPDSYGIKQGTSFLDGGLKNVDVGSVFDKKENEEAKAQKQKEQSSVKNPIKSLGLLPDGESYEERARKYLEEKRAAPPPLSPPEEETEAKPEEMAPVPNVPGYPLMPYGGMIPMHDPNFGMMPYGYQQSYGAFPGFMPMPGYPQNMGYPYGYHNTQDYETREFMGEPNFTPAVSNVTVIEPKEGSNTPAESATKKPTLLDILGVKRNKEDDRDDTSLLEVDDSVKDTRVVLPPKELKRRKSPSRDESAHRGRFTKEERALLIKDMNNRRREIQHLEEQLKELRQEQNEIMRKKRRQRDGGTDPDLLDNMQTQVELMEKVSELKHHVSMEEKTLLEAEEKAETMGERKRQRSEDDGERNMKLERRTVVLKQKEDVNTSKVAEEQEKPAKRSIYISKKDGSRKDDKIPDESGKKSEEKESRKAKVSEKARPPDNNREKSSSQETQKGAKGNEEAATTTGRKLEFIFEYYDAGNHFCRACNHVSKSLLDAMLHFHTAEHQSLSDTGSKPWLKDVKPETEVNRKVPTSKVVKAPIKGVEFTVGIPRAYYCTLCSKLSLDLIMAEEHIKTEGHNITYRKYIEDNPQYERMYVIGRQAAMGVRQDIERRGEAAEKRKSEIIDRHNKNRDTGKKEATRSSRMDSQESKTTRGASPDKVKEAPQPTARLEDKLTKKSSEKLIESPVSVTNKGEGRWSAKTLEKNENVEHQNSERDMEQQESERPPGSSEQPRFAATLSAVAENPSNVAGRNAVKFAFIGKAPFLKKKPDGKPAEKEGPLPAKVEPGATPVINIKLNYLTQKTILDGPPPPPPIEEPEVIVRQQPPKPKETVEKSSEEAVPMDTPIKGFIAKSTGKSTDFDSLPVEQSIDLIPMPPGMPEGTSTVTGSKAKSRDHIRKKTRSDMEMLGLEESDSVIPKKIKAPPPSCVFPSKAHTASEKELMLKGRSNRDKEKKPIVPGPGVSKSIKKELDSKAQKDAQLKKEQKKKKDSEIDFSEEFELLDECQ